MTILEKSADDAVVLMLDGDITMGEADACHLARRVRRLIQGGHSRIILDVGHVRYVDSAGLANWWNAVPPRGRVAARLFC